MKKSALKAWAQSESPKKRLAWLDLPANLPAKLDVMEFMELKRSGQSALSYNALAQFLKEQHGFPYSGSTLQQWIQRNGL